MIPLTLNKKTSRNNHVRARTPNPNRNLFGAARGMSQLDVGSASPIIIYEVFCGTQHSKFKNADPMTDQPLVLSSVLPL